MLFRVNLDDSQYVVDAGDTTEAISEARKQHAAIDVAFQSAEPLTVADLDSIPKPAPLIEESSNADVSNADLSNEDKK